MNSNGDEVIDLFKKCRDASVRCNNKSLEGEANGKIGQIMLRRGQAFDSIPFLTNHAQISAELGDAEARCRACSSLAYALDSLGENDRALTQLRLVHAISEQAGDIYLQSQACRALGTLYSKVGKLKDAMDSLERHFELVKAIMIREKFADTTTTSSAGQTHQYDEHGQVKPQQKAAPVERTSLETLDIARVYVGISRGNYYLNAYVQAIEFDMLKLLNWKLTRAELIPSATVTTSLL
jgi:tetratricopeptide (TPR) repeat protein